jgi:hypothetical protein
MRLAEELRAYADKVAMADDFIRQSNMVIDYAARMGYKSEVVTVPVTMSATEARELLAKEYPNCRITWRWWSKCFKVSWKERQWATAWEWKIRPW